MPEPPARILPEAPTGVAGDMSRRLMRAVNETPGNGPTGVHDLRTARLGQAPGGRGSPAPGARLFGYLSYE